MNKTVLLLFLISIGLKVSAQDTLFRGKGRNELIYVQSHNKFSVRYLTVKDGDTERHSILRKNVLQIGFADGTYLKKLSAEDWDRVRGIRRKEPPLVRGSYKNAASMLMPGFYTIAGYPGISVGLEYQRFMDKTGKLSASVSLQQVKAGTVVLSKKLHEYSTEIHATILTPGIFYHPMGNKRIVDFAFGCVVPIGSMQRKDVTPDLSRKHTNTLTGLLFQVNASVQLRKHFITGAYLSYGPMLTVGNTNGVIGAAGIKIGWWF